MAFLPALASGCGLDEVAGKLTMGQVLCEAAAMREITISSCLEAPLDRVWIEVQKPKLLLYVARPLIAFRPVAPSSFPERWEVRDYVVSMAWHDIVPLGRQTIRISYPNAPDGSKQMRDNGRSPMLRRWDHLITLEPEGSGTRYTDRVEIEAGVVTPPIASFAESFFAHRHRRWRKLVEAGFNYETG